MKKLAIIALLTGILTSISVICTFESTEEVLSRGIIRLHIRANSDSQEDQNLKLKVRDRILKESEKLFEETLDVDLAKNITEENIEDIKNIAEDEIFKNGYSYPVRVTLGKSEFPTKTYDDICLPAGTYQALVVEIGEGRGENWWCVMFPPLCYAKETVSLKEDTEKIFTQNIGKDSYDFISHSKVEVRFKLYEIWQKISRKRKMHKF